MKSENKKFYKTLAVIAIPIILQELINSSINMVDTLMIGRLGSVEITAVGLANQINFVLAVMLFGINSGSAIFMSQFWGKEDEKGIHMVMGICIMSGVVISFIFGLGSLFFSKELISIYSKDPDVIYSGAKYLRIVAFSYFIIPITFTFNTSLKSIGQTKVPMFTTLAALLTNCSLNAVLIFGLLGLPKLGVEGAAIGTLIARCVEIVLVIGIAYTYKFPIAGKIKSFFSFSREFLVKFYKTTFFVFMNETLWAVGVSLYNVAYKQTNTDAQTAVQISGTLQNLFIIFSTGIGSASGIIIGNLLGANEFDKAKKYGIKFSILTPAIGVIMGLFLMLLSPFILMLFNVNEQVMDYTNKILIIFSATLFIRCYNFTNIVGILRSGGDTFVCLLLDMCSVWLVGIPLSFLGAFVFHLPIHWLVLLASVEEISKTAFGIRRFLSFKWVRNVVD